MDPAVQTTLQKVRSYCKLKTSMSGKKIMSLKELRKRAGLTQVQVATAVEVSVDTIKRWEDGKTFPTVPQIYKIEAAYKTRFDRIAFEV